MTGHEERGLAFRPALGVRDVRPPPPDRCQRVAHNYYPTHLWRNQEKDVLAGNPYFKAHQKLDMAPAEAEGWSRYRGEQYAPDLMIEEAVRFVRDHRDRPFFLYYATPVPHAAIQVPEDSLTPYLGVLDQQPYLGQKGYLPHPEPRATSSWSSSSGTRDCSCCKRVSWRRPSCCPSCAGTCHATTSAATSRAPWGSISWSIPPVRRNRCWSRSDGSSRPCACW